MSEMSDSDCQWLLDEFVWFKNEACLKGMKTQNDELFPYKHM